MRRSFILSISLVAIVLISSCKGAGPTYKFDTVNFTIVGAVPPAAGPEPGIHIDTNIKVSSLAGGTVKSSKPYSIQVDFTDPAFIYEKIEFTKVEVTYADGTSDPGAAALKLPLTIKGRPYETVNSGAGGVITKTKVMVISGQIPGVISKDQPLSLVLEGQFIKNDGSKIPFAINRAYDVVRDTSTKPWADVMQDK